MAQITPLPTTEERVVQLQEAAETAWRTAGTAIAEAQRAQQVADSALIHYQREHGAQVGPTATYGRQIARKLAHLENTAERARRLLSGGDLSERDQGWRALPDVVVGLVDVMQEAQLAGEG